MLPVISRLFLLLLLVADYAGDPYFGRSPLSRPFSSQDAFCHSVVHRAILLKATLAASELPALHVTANRLLALSTGLPLQPSEDKHSLLAATDPVFALMSLQC